MHLKEKTLVAIGPLIALAFTLSLVFVVYSDESLEPKVAAYKAAVQSFDLSSRCAAAIDLAQAFERVPDAHNSAIWNKAADRDCLAASFRHVAANLVTSQSSLP